MKRKLFYFTGALVVLACGLGLSSCMSIIEAITGAGKEQVVTETSRMLLDAANEVLLARDNGLAEDQFKAAFVKQVPGSTVSLTVGGSLVSEKYQITYEGKTYIMETVKNSNSNRLTSAKICREQREKASNKPE